MHMFAFPNDIWSPKEIDVLSNLMQNLKKAILKQKRDLGLRTAKGKEAMSFGTY